MHVNVPSVFTECNHEVQYYDHDSFLIERLGQYIEEGWALGESVLLITTPAHREALEVRLNGQRENNQYQVLDAADTLSQFMVNEWPDRQQFHDLMDRLIPEAA